jgi:hypothetical protein
MKKKRGEMTAKELAAARAVSRAYRARNSAKLRAYYRARRARNLKKIRAKDREYRARNLAKLRAQARAYYASNIEKRRARARARRACNPAKYRAYDRAYGARWRARKGKAKYRDEQNILLAMKDWGLIPWKEKYDPGTKREKEQEARAIRKANLRLARDLPKILSPVEMLLLLTSKPKRRSYHVKY